MSGTGEMNARRAGWGKAALEHFRTRICRTETEDALADLLCDLMHMADAEEIDFAEELVRAASNYEGEKEDNE